MEKSGDGISNFLERLKNYDGRNILWNLDNLSENSVYQDLSPSVRCAVRDQIQSFMDELEKRKEDILLPMDLGFVKHYNMSRVHDVGLSLEKYPFGKTKFVSFFAGSIGEDSNKKAVVVKTWDFLYPPEDHLIDYPSRLHNEILLLTDDRYKSHPNLPKLIGYSANKKLAAIYEFNTNGVLRDALESDYLGWKFRMKVATQVASLLVHFHQHDRVIGSIDSYNILIDKENDIKLCELGFDCMPRLIGNWISPAYAIGKYSYHAPELHPPRVWTPKVDIFSFGCLLLEMITKEAKDPGTSLYDWAVKELKSGRKSVVHKSFLVDMEEGIKITELALSCMKNDPDKRPDALAVAGALEDLQQGPTSKKPKTGA